VLLKRHILYPRNYVTANIEIKSKNSYIEVKNIRRCESF